MNYSNEILYSGLGCFLLTVILVPFSMKIATFIGAMDYPGKLKIHSQPKPRFGGSAILASLMMIVACRPSFMKSIPDDVRILIILSIAGIFLIGVWDDVKNLKAIHKLIFQLFSICLAVIGLYMLEFESNIVYYFLIFAFILGYTNAFNLIDGLDGLATGIAIITFFGLFVISIFIKLNLTIIISLLMITSLLGFLIFNFKPAIIFLGDCGSTLIGFIIGTLMSIIWLHSTNKISLIPLLIVAGLPILDTSSAIIRRIKQKKSILAGDRNHLYDLMLQRGFSLQLTILLFYLSTFVLSTVGVISYIIIEF